MVRDMEQTKPDPHAVQRAALSALLGRAVRVRLTDGKVLTGVLGGHDTFTLLLTRRAGDVLIFKHAVAHIAASDSDSD